MAAGTPSSGSAATQKTGPNPQRSTTGTEPGRSTRLGTATDNPYTPIAAPRRWAGTSWATTVDPITVRMPNPMPRTADRPRAQARPSEIT